MSDDIVTCDRCENESVRDLTETIDLDGDRLLCSGCIHALIDSIERHDWQDRYTEEHHERALTLLSDRDEIDCVISEYDTGRIVVHTAYVSSDVVMDFCKHFGFKIARFEPVWAQESQWPCSKDHGDCFQIVLKYDHDCPDPIPVNAKFFENHIDDLEGNDRQF